MDQIKYEVVAMSIAMFQRELEKQYERLGIKYDFVIQHIVLEYASRLMSANKMFPEAEKDGSQTQASTLQGKKAPVTKYPDSGTQA